MSQLKISIALLMLFGVAAMAQTPDTNGVVLLTTNEFPDGSTIEIMAVSYGVIHRIPSPYGKPRFVKSESPTIMFTTCRHAFWGQSLGDGDSDDIFTKAEALDPSGKWYPLHHAGPHSYDILGPIRKFPETWDFPECPEPSALIRVRIWTTRKLVNSACVEFHLPNDIAWRERSIKEETNALHSSGASIQAPAP